jgi:ABC-2 type transport system ATP-binding protein
VAFVSVEAYRPDVLLLDEPTTGLDPVIRIEIRNAIIGGLKANPRRVVFFSTHLVEDVESVADRILLISDGAMLDDIPIDPDASPTERHEIARSCVNALEKASSDVAIGSVE